MNEMRPQPLPSSAFLFFSPLYLETPKAFASPGFLSLTPGATQEFNARTSHITPGTPMPVRVTVRGDRSFHFDVRTPQTSWLLKNAAACPPGKKGKKKGASQPGHEVAGTISLKHVYEVAKIKQSELRLSGLPLEGLCKSVIYQCRSIGIEVVP